MKAEASGGAEGPGGRLMESLHEALNWERLRNAHLLNPFRFLAITVFLVLTVWARVVEPPVGGYQFPGLLLAYWLVAGVIAGVGWRIQGVAIAGSLGVPLLDMPLVFLIQMENLQISSAPRAVANFSLGLFICMVMAAAMSLRRWQVRLGTGMAVGLQLWLGVKAKDTVMGTVGGACLLALAAALCELARRRRLELVEAVCRQQLRRERLGRFFSPQVAKHIEGQVDEFGEGQRCEVTVLFGDIRDFTALSETLETAELVALLNEFHGRMVETVFAYGGTLDKYTGDGLMAYFGAPLPQADHAERAVRCALAMQAGLAEMNVGRVTRGQAPIRMGIGVHSGPAVVGSIGAPHRREFTVVGDTVNLASRLEQLTKQLDEPIIVSEETRGRTGEDTVFRRLESTAVKGRTKPISPYVPTPLPQGEGGEAARKADLSSGRS